MILTIVKITVKVIRDPEGKYSWKGHYILPLGGNKVGIAGNTSDITAEIQAAFTDTKYSFNICIMNHAKLLTLILS